MFGFGTLIDSLLSDPNLGLCIRYKPISAVPVDCRASFAQPDMDVQITTTKVRDRKRILLVKACDVTEPNVRDTIEIPKGGPDHKVLSFTANDSQRITWRLEIVPL